MIQTAALPAAIGLPQLGELPPLPAVEGLEVTNFGVFLAVEAESLSPSAALPKPPVPPVLPVCLLAPRAEPLPEAGKDLPVGLPVLPRLPKAASLDPEPVVPGEAEPCPAAPPARPIDEAEGPVPADPAPAPQSCECEAPAGIAMLVAPPRAASGEQPSPSPSPPSGTAARSDPRAPAPTAPLPVPASQPQPAPPVQPAPAPAALAVFAVPNLSGPPRDDARLRLVLPAASASKARTAPEPAALPNVSQIIAETAVPAIAAPTVPVQTPPVAAPHFPADPAQRPADFTQLVDRLVAAREMTQPQAFQVALQHGEFGSIQLRFRHEGESLSVAMASTDPDFARAVSSAPVPVLPILAGETAAQTGARPDSQSQNAATSGGSAQHRGAPPDRREDRSGPADNPAPRQSERHAARRSGIFA